jgi:hypothetical protein
MPGNELLIEVQGIHVAVPLPIQGEHLPLENPGKFFMSRQSDNVLFCQNRNVLFWEC